MKLARGLWSVNAALSLQFRNPHVNRAFSASPSSVPNEWQGPKTSESVDDSEERIFGNQNRSSSMSYMSSYYRNLDKVERARNLSGMGFSFMTNQSNPLHGLGDDHDTLSDGLDRKLKQAATYFDFNPDEVVEENYSFRADANFSSGMTYDTKDLDLTRPAARKPNKRNEFETTTEEVLQKADFRNVKFLANFITDAGIIVKRSKTGISAKAQRKVAREIKTARAFGLMPFTTMGTKQFVYGKTMEDDDRDFEFEASYDRNFVDDREDALDA